MKKIVVGNWKMFGSNHHWKQFMSDLEPFLNPHIHVIVCPPFPYLFLATHKAIDIGAQNCHGSHEGPFTGEVSADMLRDVGCRYVIVGHSERRKHESDIQITQKVKAAKTAGLIPILCVGETKTERENDQTYPVIQQQLSGVLKENLLTEIIIAYEPVWAIGTGVSAGIRDIIDRHTFIRSLIPGTPILYGGSVSRHNAFDILSQPEVDGVLVGGASLDAFHFGDIINAGQQSLEKE